MPRHLDLADSDDEDEANWTHPGSLLPDSSNAAPGPHPGSLQPETLALEENADTSLDDEGADLMDSTQSTENKRGEIGINAITITDAATPQLTKPADAVDTSEAILEENTAVDEVAPAEVANAVALPSSAGITASEAPDTSATINVEATHVQEFSTSEALEVTEGVTPEASTDSGALPAGVRAPSKSLVTTDANNAAHAPDLQAVVDAIENNSGALEATVTKKNVTKVIDDADEVSGVSDIIETGALSDDGVSGASDNAIVTKENAFQDAGNADEVSDSPIAPGDEESVPADTNATDEATGAADAMTAEESALLGAVTADEFSYSLGAAGDKESVPADTNATDEATCAADAAMTAEESALLGAVTADEVSDSLGAPGDKVGTASCIILVDEVQDTSNAFINEESTATSTIATDGIPSAAGTMHAEESIPRGANVIGVLDAAGNVHPEVDTSSGAIALACDVGDEYVLANDTGVGLVVTSVANIEATVGSLGEIFQPDVAGVTSNPAEANSAAHNNAVPISGDTSIVAPRVNAATASALGQEPSAPIRKPKFNARATQKSLASASMSALLSTARVSAAAAADDQNFAEDQIMDTSDKGSSSTKVVSLKTAASTADTARTANALSAAQIALAVLAEADKEDEEEEEAAALAALAAAEEQHENQSSSSGSDDDDDEAEEDNSASTLGELVSRPEAIDSSLPRGILLTTTSASSREGSPPPRRKRGSVQFALEGVPLPPPEDDAERVVGEEDGSRGFIVGFRLDIFFARYDLDTIPRRLF